MGHNRYLMQSPVLHYFKVKSGVSGGKADLFGNVEVTALPVTQ